MKVCWDKIVSRFLIMQWGDENLNRIPKIYGDTRYQQQTARGKNVMVLPIHFMGCKIL